MLYGAVGYDKSTFLRALLGGVALKSGSISLASLSVAYTGQQLWLLSATMLANMIGHESGNPVLYRKVVSICALDVDSQQLPDGNETIAGNAGTILSGGQMHRVSLARALYSEADITVQDDPFSALGEKTLALVRSRLFAKGNATAKGRTLDLIKVSLEEAVAYPEDFVRQKKAEAEDDGNSEELPAVNEVEESEKTILAKN